MFLSKSINTIELDELSARTSSDHPSEIASPDPHEVDSAHEHSGRRTAPGSDSGRCDLLKKAVDRIGMTRVN